MRKALNSNPLVQVGAIALLGVIVAFLMLTRLSSDEAPPPDDAATATADPAAPAVTPAPEGAVPTDPAVPATPTDPAVPAAPAGEFVAGPGLPSKVVDAYDSGDTVMLLVTRRGGIDDEELRKLAERAGSEPGVAFFHSYAKDVADYSRIAQGVEIDRVPALITIAPEAKAEGPPVATIAYGFRGYEGVRQAIRDAAYDGKQLPFHPE